MIVYRVTVTIDSEAEAEWLAWMRAAHVPDVMATGCFTERRIARVAEPAAPEGKAAYSLEYVCRSMSDYEAYREKFAPALQAEHSARYAGRFTASRTLLEIIA